MPIFSKGNLSDDEVAYVALHFMAALERLKEKQKFNILVICATGYGSALMLKNRIVNELGNLVHIVDDGGNLRAALHLCSSPFSSYMP